MYKFVVLSALVAVASAGLLGAPTVVAPGARLGSPYGSPYAAPLAYAPRLAAPLAVAPRLAAPLAYAQGPVVAKAVVGAAVDTDYDPNPSYSYAYDVQDALTGDSKNQQESRQGDVVQGSYSLVEPDGTRRTVEYTADPVNGFNAVVHREPIAVAKAVVAAPAYAKVAAPLAYAAAPALAHAPLGYASPLGYARSGLIGAPVARLAAPGVLAAPGYARLGSPILG